MRQCTDDGEDDALARATSFRTVS